MHSVVILAVVMLSVAKLGVVKLCVVILSVVRLYVAAPPHYLVDGGRELSVSLEIHVRAGVDGVLVLILPELQREQGVLAPGNVLFDVDLILGPML